MTVQRKHAVHFEVKTINDDGFFSGYGSVYDVEDSYKEVVKPGAFRKSLADWKKKGKLPVMLWQHDSSQPIGIYTVMREDEHGLYVEGRLLIDSVAQAKEAHALLKVGAIGGLSIGFVTRRSEMNNDTRVRSLIEIDLWEVSLVTFPANQQAGITLVKSADEIQTVRQFENFLEEHGFSAREATLITVKGFKAALAERDSKQANGDDAGEPQSLDGLIDALKKRGAAIEVLTANKH
jgi:HK97 family phage prohead protease